MFRGTWAHTESIDSLFNPCDYRRKPKKLEAWAVVYDNGSRSYWSTRQNAEQHALTGHRIVHLVESP